MDVVEDAAARQLHLPAKEGNAGAGEVRAQPPAEWATGSFAYTQECFVRV